MKNISLACLIASSLVLSACGSAGKIRENRKKRDTLIEKSGMFCDMVKVDPSIEMEIELNIKMASFCDPKAPHSMTYYPLDTEIRGIVFCCAVKKPESRTENAAEDVVDVMPAPVPSPTPATPKASAKTGETNVAKKR